MNKNWNNILAPDQGYQLCYPKVNASARDALSKVKSNETMGTSWLVVEIVGRDATRPTRTRCARALRALAKREDGLKHYHFTAMGNNHFRPGEKAVQYFWHAYKAPAPVPICELCGQEIKGED
jgi:hypothetical protein